MLFHVPFNNERIFESSWQSKVPHKHVSNSNMRNKRSVCTTRSSRVHIECSMSKFIHHSSTLVELLLRAGGSIPVLV